MNPAPTATPWVPAYIALGSNLADPPARLRAARAALGALPESRVVAGSACYAGPPLDRSAQPDYLNAVVALLTRLPATELLAALLAIEAAEGRVRSASARWGPRSLDLDLIAYGERRISTPGLEVPHPGAGQRDFVLLPLAELAPDLWLPGMGRVRELARRVAGGELRRLSQDAPEPSSLS